MNKKLWIAAVPMVAASCATEQGVVVLERTRVLIDSTYDAAPDSATLRIMEPYAKAVDSIMSPIVGRTARELNVERPESPLSNLLADILKDAATSYGEAPDFAVYNIGGIRASLPGGDITKGDVLNVAPFENRIGFLTLKGSDVMELFEQIAAVGGEGVSHGVELRIAKDGRLKSAKLHGKEIVKDRAYRIATIDYLMEGNDKMEAFRKKTDAVEPKGSENNMAVIIERYLSKQLKAGKTVDAECERRITIE